MYSKFIAITSFLIFSFSANANNPVELTVSESIDAGVFNITYRSYEKGNVRITLYNASNVVVFSESLNNMASFNRPYNFKGMATGEYTVVVEGKHGKQAEKINYQLNKVTSYVRVAEIKDQPNKYWLSITTEGSQKVEVQILSANGSELYNETVTVKNNHSVVYNLNQVSKLANEVTFIVKTRDGQHFSINF